MDTFIRLLLECTLAMSAVIAATLALLPALRRLCSARSISLVFLILIAGLLVPWRLFPVEPALTLTLPAAAPAAQTVSRPGISPAATAATSLDAVSGTQTGPGLQSASSAQPSAVLQSAPTGVQSAPAVSRPRLRAQEVLALVWFAGFAAVLGGGIVSHVRFSRMARRWAQPICDPAVQQALREAQRKTGINGRIRLWRCPSVKTPMLIGIRHPTILLPDFKLDEQELSLVLCHEAMHAKRRDILQKALLLIGTALHWFNPLVWVLARMQAYYCEAACDEAVLRGRNTQERQYYAETILAVIRRQLGPRTALSTSFYGGKKAMKNRILAILSLRHKRLGALLIALALLLTCTAGLSFALGGEEAPALSLQDQAALTEEEAVALAKETVISNVVYDFGLQGLGTAGNVTYETIEWGGEALPVMVVPLTARTGDGSVYSLLVYLSIEDGDVLRITDDFNGTVFEKAHPIPTAAPSQTWTAWIACPISGAANMCTSADDYESASELLFNGVQVTVLATLPTMGGYPSNLFDDPDEMWAYISVGETKEYAGAMGYVPLVCLATEDPGTALPVATLATTNETGYISVMVDNGLTRDAVAGTFPAGTQVEVLGQTNTYYHVRTDECTGFVPLANLSFGPDTAALVESCQPQLYDEIQPGWMDRYNEYHDQLAILYNRYGDSNTWPLEIRAQASQLAMDFGFEWLRGMVCILPGEGDFTQEEAVARAAGLAKEAFGVDVGTATNTKVSFYYTTDNPEQRLWQVRFWMGEGQRDCSITMDAAGTLVESWQSDYTNGASYADDGGPVAGEMDYYLLGYGADPTEEEMTQEQAEALARSIFLEAYPPSAEREYSVSAWFLEDATQENRWWLVNFKEKQEEYQGLDFSVALIAPDGAVEYHQKDYAERVAEREHEREYEALVAERGPSVTWTMEQKADWSPDYFALPDAGAVSQEEALAAAKSALAAADATVDVDALTAYASYTLEGQWRFDLFTAGQIQAEDYSDPYTVFVDGATGEIADVWLPGGNG